MKKVHITLNKNITEQFIDNAVELLTARYDLQDVNLPRVQSLKIVTGQVDESKLDEIRSDSLVETVSEDQIRSIN